ncbi:MAG: amidohydrolase family protein [Desulfomonile sp.]|jgi:predicted TIM-barrel fold metal-dependent hydrolase|nr:amidohydrolase family protein [Deltaproteobacteria bacterium]
MAVLDFHLHVGTKHHWNPWVISFFQENNPEYIKRFVDEITPVELLSYLDGQAVDHAVVLAEYAPVATGVVTNEFAGKFCSQTDRLIPFGSICLYQGTDLAQQAEQCVSRLGCRGLKLLPSYAHFHPYDSKLLPVYEVARDLKIPVMFHTGTSIFRGSRIRYANPLLLDDVADEFPDLSIIICHGGRPFWYQEAQWMLRRHKNTYIDVSGIPLKRLPSIFPHLNRFQDRFLFGSDWPGVRSIEGQVRLIRNLPVGEKIIEAILWENGYRLLGLNS